MFLLVSVKKKWTAEPFRLNGNMFGLILGLLGTGSPGRLPRLSHSSLALRDLSCFLLDCNKDCAVLVYNIFGEGPRYFGIQYR